MNLRIVNDTIVGLPDGNTVFFLAKANLHGVIYCYAIFGPTATCLPKPGETFTELFDAKVAVFRTDGSMYALYYAHHGHKYALGGGMVEIISGRSIVWTTPDECGCTRIFGERIHPRDILIAL
ncbi:MAG: hypothetical protein UY31_C0006G0022 [Candidatus Wolfebacteria bacterium GW2011_GWE1_48_7]|uniref:Uncharacterized protein n=2 Tax=Candidatus Wolfeibacteriota TaxID=1752735 RepID=A0A0G1U4I3_9BACT|nr:MAG: hypothetical protein UX70_C0001G0044 [Candidatus Wolfebacteria bacterium GW2011_GWB1_47_1]KKU36584.1 MAG: hypothetical protein UX49_C0013G0026 [Candidatus Wolfebacteria bacterium GW2011_GWC2_46_275]KKU59011.1 MAG: hypothetical protein UX83_C0009G0027 [Candidatus Wolfebacteria bacterium GW2011_GWE2_47_12]KKU65503.1 MAG: hypothetical protein UX90_C0004G0027 [Candidatus Wolfebacteria bacterium GW2011_GWD2_47_17]KKU73112.1 MAG: hypothetical protein UX96_C0009G0026 [Candidatus Wolfebacteria 